MALHGEIVVNAQPIAGWCAVRQPASPDIHRYNPDTGGFVYTYDCEVVRYKDGLKVNFELNHDYNDGALALAAAVINMGHYHLQKMQEIPNGNNR